MSTATLRRELYLLLKSNAGANLGKREEARVFLWTRIRNYGQDPERVGVPVVEFFVPDKRKTEEMVRHILDGTPLSPDTPSAQYGAVFVTVNLPVSISHFTAVVKNEHEAPFMLKVEKAILSVDQLRTGYTEIAGVELNHHIAASIGAVMLLKLDSGSLLKDYSLLNADEFAYLQTHLSLVDNTDTFVGKLASFHSDNDLALRHLLQRSLLEASDTQNGLTYPGRAVLSYLDSIKVSSPLSGFLYSAIGSTSVLAEISTELQSQIAVHDLLDPRECAAIPRYPVTANIPAPRQFEVSVNHYVDAYNQTKNDTTELVKTTQIAVTVQGGGTQDALRLSLPPGVDALRFSSKRGLLLGMTERVPQRENAYKTLCEHLALLARGYVFVGGWKGSGIDDFAGQPLRALMPRHDEAGIVMADRIQKAVHVSLGAKAIALVNLIYRDSVSKKLFEQHSTGVAAKPSASPVSVDKFVRNWNTHFDAFKRVSFPDPQIKAFYYLVFWRLMLYIL